MDDNAFELAGLLIPKGYEFFRQLSAYDDYLADIVEKEGYKPGDTLRLQVPFLKAYGATNEILARFSAENINVLSGTRDCLQYLNTKIRSYLISTSYEPYIRAFCSVVGFPFENTACTQLDIDKYELNHQETHWLKQLAKEIVSLPEIVLPPHATTPDALQPDVLKAIERLDQIFWDEMEKKDSFRILEEVKPIGGSEKERVIVQKASDIGNVVYTGDSITDREAFRRVNQEGGLTISVNGNMFAVREAELGCLIENVLVTAILVDAFFNGGKDGVLDLGYNWNMNGLKIAKKHKLVKNTLVNSLLTMYPEKLPEVVVLSDENREEFGKRSSAFRKQVRGEQVGALG